MEDILMNSKEWFRVKVFEQVNLKIITLFKASELLFLTYRHTKRLWKKFRGEGKRGIVSRKRGITSNRAICEDRKKETIKIITECYLGFKPIFVKEKLEDHKIDLSSETIRKWMTEYKLWFPNAKEEKYPSKEKKERV